MSKKRSKDEDDVPSLPNPPSLIEYGDMRFLIFDAPSDDNVDVYAKVRSISLPLGRSVHFFQPPGFFFCTFFMSARCRSASLPILVFSFHQPRY
jgi:hypothetical protein